MILDSNHSLTLGALELDELPNPSRGWWIEATTEGTDWGNPEAIISEIESFLTDGGIETTESYGNRTLTIRVMLHAETSADLARAEAALVAELGKRNTLTWVPPDDSMTAAGEPCVFEVVNSYVDHAFDDINELHLQRAWVLTIKALPWARAQDSTTITVPPPAGAVETQLLDACNSTSGWSFTTTNAYGIMTATGGSIRLFLTRGSDDTYGGILTRSGLSFNDPDLPYVRIEHTGSTVLLNGVETLPTATNGTAYWYERPPGVLTTVGVGAFLPPRSLNSSMQFGFTVADITASSAPQDGSTGKQGFRTLQIGGSVRTQGSLAVRDADSALGSVLLYTSPQVNGMQPPLRQYKYDGGSDSIDPATVSGFSSTLSVTTKFLMSASVIPSGGYQLLARVKRAAAGPYTLTWKAVATMDGDPLSESETFTVTPTAVGTGFEIVALGSTILPPSRMGPYGSVQIEITSDGTTLDEAWLFSNDGALTWVNAPATARRVWLDDATVEQPTPQVSVGILEDRVDAFDPGLALRAWGQHELQPGANNVFLVTTESQAAFLDVMFFERFHTHVVGRD